MESDMRSYHKDAILKRTLQLKTKKVDTESLVSLGRMLKKTQRLTFTAKYRRILDLLEVDVQVEVIIALAQYYDPPLRCFTFQDFQLVPTLEEFEQILGLSLEKEKPYQYMDHYASMPTIADVLKVHVKDLQKAKQNSKRTEGFPRKYFEKHMRYLTEAEDWNTFADVLALTIYGSILFPSNENLVDFAAIDVFLARKNDATNPVPTILADVYYTLNFCHEKKGKRILCCLPMLFVWLTTHIFKRGYKEPCPIADLKMFQLKTMNVHEWAEELAKLEERNIIWYPRWKVGQTVIYHYEGFPNVPLIGTRGYINYNPALALRQLGYPMMGPSLELETTHFICDTKTKCNELLRKVRDAWKKVIRKSKELGVRSCGVKESYRQWVKNRSQEVKLPFKISTTFAVSKSLPLVSIEDEEIKEKLAEANDEKGKLEVELGKIRQAYAVLKHENSKKSHALERASKRQKTEQDNMSRTRRCLEAANKELGFRGQERDRVLAENQQLKELLANTKAEQNNTLQQVDNMRQQMKMVLAGYEDPIKIERLHIDKTIAGYKATLQQGQEDLQKLIDLVKQKDKDIVDT